MTTLDTYRAACQRRDAAKAAGDRAAYVAAAAECGRIARALRARGIDPLAPEHDPAALAAAVDAVIERQRRNDAVELERARALRAWRAHVRTCANCFEYFDMTSGLAAACREGQRLAVAAGVAGEGDFE